MKYIRIVNGPISENSYIVFDEESKEAAIIDPGFTELKDIDEIIKSNDLNLIYIINTHGHWDHIKNNSIIENEYGAKILIHKDDEHLIKDPDKMNSFYFNEKIIPTKAYKYLNEGEQVLIGKTFLNILYTPGHTGGSVVLYNDEYAFTGDTLFYGSIGRCDLPTGDKEIMINSLEKLKKNIPLTSIILPGHGIKETTFKEEFVTAGGIDLAEIDANTMMSKKINHLYFAGEVLNIDGITGGYNFQNAWTTGFIVAKSIKI